MDLIDRISARRRGAPALDWPVGPAVVEPFDQAHGHDASELTPEFYGDYIATSNEVYAAVSLRARLASSVRLRCYQGDTADKRELPDSPVAQLLRHVNPHWTWPRLARMDEMSMGLWGQTMWAIEKDSNGRPREIWWLKPSRVRPVPHPEKYLAGFLYESNVGGEIIPFDADEIVWQRYPHPLDEYAALSPVSAARLAADTGSAMMKANRNLHDNGLQIAGILHPKQREGAAVQFSKEQADELANDLQTRFAGASKAHRWAVLRYEAEFKPVNLSPKDAEFVLGLGLTLRQVANAYGVPSPLLNDLEHATLANLREFQKAMWEHALVPDLRLRAAEIEEQLLPMYGRGTGRLPVGIPDHVEYDFSQVAALQESQTSAWDRERQAIEVGAMTINEWRKQRGLPAVAWGDVWFCPVNKAPVSDATGPKVAEGTSDDAAGSPGGEDLSDELARTLGSRQAWLLRSTA